MKGISYVTDGQNKKVAVQIELKVLERYDEQMEDLIDGIIAGVNCGMTGVQPRCRTIRHTSIGLVWLQRRRCDMINDNPANTQNNVPGAGSGNPHLLFRKNDQKTAGRDCRTEWQERTT